MHKVKMTQAEGLRLIISEPNLVLHILCDFGVLRRHGSGDMGLLSRKGDNFLYISILKRKIRKVQ